MEIWRYIPGTNNEYQVSSAGRVKTTKTGRLLKLTPDGFGIKAMATSL